MPHPLTYAQTTVRAAESTANVPSGRIARNVQKRILLLDPDAAPLTLILAKARSQIVGGPKYEWQEKDLEARWDAINNGAGYNSSVTSIVVDNANKFQVNDVVNIVRTQEKVRVTAVTTSTNTLTIARAVGSTAAAAIVDNDDLQLIGSAYAEGVGSQTEKSWPETQPYNYTQIFRTPFGVTRTMQNTETYLDKDDRSRLRMEKAITHRIDLERAFIFGERNLDTSAVGTTNNPIRYTGGFVYYATENIKDFGGTLTEPEMEDWSADLFHHTAGSDTRLLFASAKALSVLNQLAVARIQMVPKEKTFGLSISQWITAHGTFLIAKHRLLENGTVSSQGFGSWMLAVEPSRLAYRPLGNSDTKLRPDIQNNDEDKVKDEYLTEVGFQLENPRLHGIGKNITQ